jgi:pimeloyl-ACP methyl ester carboxylesterase
MNAPLPLPLPRTAEDVLRILHAGPMRTVDVDGIRVATWSVGRGPDLVLLHGWPLHSATFRGLVPALAGSFTCHLIDLPGAGATRCEPGTAGGLPGYARIVRQALTGLGLARYAVLAHDSGAGVARFLAAADGDRVVGLVLAGTEIPGHRPWQIRLFNATIRLPGGPRMLARSLGWAWVRHSPIGLGGCFTDPRSGDGEFFDLFVAPLIRSRAALNGQLGLLKDWDWSVIDSLARAHAAIRAPVCMIWGADDPFFPVAKARALPQQFAGEAEFHEIAGARLFLHEDHPDEFLALALPFLLRVTDRTS